eukprot:Gregarina_sp_Poly_1__1643@NODE_141_length_12988_cov_478_019271_g126_i0_p4_GENE_NODE_141_length_12988_cov_478_019271_g126_i0NODE_141_length_12988_cov_478_019271_g126_i0_p4_ORF_typecomplete_len507_score62_55Hexokinase_1/PF00349_21/5_3e49Hexokinase_2/PF03727_16/1_2e43_NODE_141_length_12988_cov_478_019271_g126_i014332953
MSGPVLESSSHRRPSTESLQSLKSIRSRAWSEDIQKHWTLPVPIAETFDQRFARYIEYFSISSDQIEIVHNNICAEMEDGCRKHQARVKNLPIATSSLKMLDTCVKHLPNGSEKGVGYALDFSGTTVRAVRVRAEGNHKLSTVEHRLNIRDERTAYPKGLLDKNCGAMALFNYLANSVGDLLKKSGAPKTEVPLGFSLSFPCELRSLDSATLLEWTKGFETGRATADPVEGLDVVTLLDMAFWRQQINAKVKGVVNDATATLLACAYEQPSRLPPCTVAFLVGVGLNGAYVEPQAASYGYQGCIINTELGGFDKGLPITDVDLEVDFADDGARGRQIFEKMIGGGYLGEICRRLVVKVWQTEAPALSWARQSLPTAAAALCVSDNTENLDMVQKLMMGLWDWDTSRECRKQIQKMFSLVFDRSAALAAACIAALAKKSGRLQPAMGGVTVAIDGALHTSHPWYSDNVRVYLKQILGEDTAQYIHLFVSLDGSAKGAAIMAEMNCRT